MTCDSRSGLTSHHANVVERLRKLASKRGLSDEVQQLISLIANILARKDVMCATNQYHFQLDLVIDGLEAEPPNTRLARDILYDVDGKTVTFANRGERYLLREASGSPIS